MLLQPTDAMQTPIDSNVWMASLLVILTDAQLIRSCPVFNETLFTRLILTESNYAAQLLR